MMNDEYCISQKAILTVKNKNKELFCTEGIYDELNVLVVSVKIN